jgi:hypothetical protein
MGRQVEKKVSEIGTFFYIILIYTQMTLEFSVLKLFLLTTNHSFHVHITHQVFLRFLFVY